jgi:hypothetical protein
LDLKRFLRSISAARKLKEDGRDNLEVAVTLHLDVESTAFRDRWRKEREWLANLHPAATCS